MVDVIDSFMVVTEEVAGVIAIDRADWPGEHEADLSFAWAMIRSSDEVYSSRSRRNDALRS